jgi:hypothetical protein
MSRQWYAAILNWARFVPSIAEVEIDMLYSIGKYREDYPSLVINSISAIPGCEGTPLPLNDEVAIFGLGFDELAPLCVLDQVEPDVIYSFLACPAAFNDYPERARNCNQELIRHSMFTLELPLRSVQMSYSSLAEVVSKHYGKENVTLIPMGPKPHVLACILLAFRFGSITCLRVSGKRTKSYHIEATGEIVPTRINFKAQRV